MVKRLKFTCIIAVVGLLAGNLQADPSQHFKVFLCFGQSNMSGGSGVTPNTNEDKQTNPRIFTVGFGSCQGWTDGKWALAKEPLHCGDNINAMGPAYAFARAMADSLPNDTIGLVPYGLYGRPLSCWLKDGTNMGSGGPTPGCTETKNVYPCMLKRCKYAQERGVFTGIVMHQGESNNGDGMAYLSKIKQLYKDLKTDLGLTKDIPYVAGELRGDAQAVQKNPSNPKFNEVINKIGDSIPYGYAASSKDCGQYNNDSYILHFNQDGLRLMGRRMAVEMMKGLRKIETAIRQPHRVISAVSLNFQRNDLKVYSLNGRFISTGVAMAKTMSLKPGSIYVVTNNTGAALKLMIAPKH
jgi:hypothetical protein